MATQFQAVKAHFTYKTHIDLVKIETLMRTFGDIKIWSIVHEVGDKDEDNPTPYEHTHIFVWWTQKIYSNDLHAFDIGGIHPHWKTDKGLKWAHLLCTKYHKGHKIKANGKKFFVEPILLQQKGVDEWEFEKELIDTIIDAPDLKSACFEVGINPKTKKDVKLLHKDKKRKFTEIDNECDKSRFKKIEWDRSKALIVRGNTGTGKTNWALSQFEQPMLVCDLDDLRNLPQECDGLVFDDMSFDNSSKNQQVCLTDMAFERSIRTRHTNAKIPKGLPRIFCCNENEYAFGKEPHGAVKRRVVDLGKPFDFKFYI